MIINYRCIPGGYEDENVYGDGWSCNEPVSPPAAEIVEASPQQDSSEEEQRVNVLPDVSIGVGLGGANFDYKLTEEETSFFIDLKQLYIQFRNNPNVTRKLTTYYKENPDAKRVALKFFCKSPGNNNLRSKNMAVLVLETLCNITNIEQAKPLDNETRYVAFNLVKNSGNLSLCHKMSEAYELEAILFMIKPQLQEMLSQGQFQTVAYWAVALNLINTYGIYDLIFPLILQDRVGPVEEILLKSTEEQQYSTVQFLDSLLDRKRTVYDYCNELIKKYKYTDIKLNILNHRPMSKLVGRLAKKLKIDPMYTPNLQHSKTVGYIHYLFYKFKDGGMSRESFRELAKEEIGNCKELQIGLINLMINSNYWSEASYWIHYFNIPTNEWPKSFRKDILQQFVDRTSSENHHDEFAVNENQPPELAQQTEHNEQEEYHTSRTQERNGTNRYRNRRYNSSKNRTNGYTTRSNRNRDRRNRVSPPSTAHQTSINQNNGTSKQIHLNHFEEQDLHMPRTTEYLQFPLSPEKIIIVDTRDKFLNMLDDLEHCTVVGFDSEWKPSSRNDNTIALLQLALKDKVFLVDCVTDVIPDELWIQLGDVVFNNHKVLKLGFAIDQDIRMLAPKLLLYTESSMQTYYLDLKRLWRTVRYMPKVNFPYVQTAIAGESLNVLAEVCLGKKLDKSDQCSNWAKRPLRREQIMYAALDAYCLLQIYDVLIDMLHKENIDVEDVLSDVLGSGNGFRKLKIAQHRNETEDDSGSDGAAGATDAAAAAEVGENRNLNNLRNLNNQVIAKEEVSMYTTKFICDIMFVGLGRELRKLGFDCLQVYKNAPFPLYLERANNENRYILTRGARYTEFRKYIPAKQCFDLPTDATEKLVINLITYLNVRIDRNFFYTRCLKCNSREFILASRHDMEIIRFGHVLSNSRKVMDWQIDEIKTWKLFSMSYYVLQSKKTHRGKMIKFDDNDLRALELYDYFYICNKCGVWTCQGANSMHSKIKSFLKYREMNADQEQNAEAPENGSDQSPSSSNIGDDCVEVENEGKEDDSSSNVESQ